MRNYGYIAKDYGYSVAVIDLRNPTRSNANNLLHLVNKYMDLYKEYPDELAYKAKAEKYAKIISNQVNELMKENDAAFEIRYLSTSSMEKEQNLFFPLADKF